MFAFFWVAWTVTWTARQHAAAIGSDVGRTYLICGVWTIFLWFLYPIAWGLSEGGNVISPDSEAVFYGILDLMAKPVFGALLLWGHRNIDPGRLGRKCSSCISSPSNTKFPQYIFVTTMNLHHTQKKRTIMEPAVPPMATPQPRPALVSKVDTICKEGEL